MQDISENPPAEKNGILAKAKEEQEDQGGSFKNYLRIFSFADRLDWTLNVVACLASIGGGATLPLMTIIFGKFITKFNNFSTGATSPAEFRANVDTFVLWFIYLFVVRFALSYISTLTITISATRTTRAFRQAFLQHTLRQEIWHFDKQRNGAVATQVTTNGNRIHQGIAEKLTFLFQSLALFSTSFIVAIAVQWKLALITISIVPAMLIVTAVCLAISSKQEARVMRVYSRASALAEEAFSSVRTIHAFWAYSKMSEQYNDHLQAAHIEGNKKSPILSVFFATEYFFVYSGIALSFWQGFRMFQSGEVENAGQVFTVVLSVTIAASATSQFAPQLFAFMNASAAASELFGVIDKPSLLDPLSKSGTAPARVEGKIEFRNVHFAYPSRPDCTVLYSLNLSIPAGKTTALVGASGCGKSTLVGLLERWYEPISGQILLDNVDVSQYNTRWLRNRIRLVQQEPALFRGTVFHNVLNGLVHDRRVSLSEDEQMVLVRQACIASNAHDFIEELPHGYFTEVGERAALLSGGQRQRIAIARSIIADPTILLLDEATSALDPRAEQVVQEALNKVSVNRTTLVIAHKLSTIKNADSIAVMSYGKIVEQGTHEELIAANGHYARLVAAQDLGRDKNAPLENEMKEEAEIVEEHCALQPSKSKPDQPDIEANVCKTGTLNYSLARCIYIMLKEQKSLYPFFLISGFACLIAGATWPAQALLYSRLLRVFVLPADQAQVQANLYALMFFVVALGNMVAYGIIGFTFNIVSQTVTHRYRLEMFDIILKQDMDFFDQPENSSGALTSRISNLPTQLQELIGVNIMLIFVVLVNIVSSSALALAFGWKLGLVVIFGGLPALLASGYLRIRLETKLNAINEERFSESASLASEAVMAIRTVASLTMETAILEEYSQMLRGIAQRSTKSLPWMLVLFSLSQSLDFLVMALGFWYGSQLLSTGEYNTTQFYIIFIGVVFAGQAAAQFFTHTTSITNATGAANYILWLRTLKPVMQENKGSCTNAPKGDGRILLDDVEYRYPQREASWVLKGLSVNIEPGQYAAIVGPSGCGKSTMISLLERFYDPTSGRICFDDEDIKTFSPRLYRQSIALVQQEPTLYQGSVRANISIGLETGPTDAQIEAACQQANALEFIQSLPEGFQTPCGSRGLQFSGGQRQRIAIARALIRNPALLLLDEATSALDTESERVVQTALDEAATKRTTVAVAHRLSTIRNADVIFVFANGKIAEQGTHGDLQRMKGIYHEMCLAQSLDQA